MSDKEFKTLDEQLAILSSRGLVIEDETVAKAFLLHNNYYRVSGYSLTLRNHDVFSPHASMQNIIDIYEFDHEFRHILLKYIDTIEVKFKSVYAYHFTRIYVATGYRDVSNFIDSARHKSVLDNGDSQKKNRKDHEAYIKHFVDDLHQELPLWAYVDLLTIAEISKLYAISEIQVQDSVAAGFGLNANNRSSLLGQFMHSMTVMRNLCAHGSRLYNRLFSRKPSLKKDERKLLIVNSDGTIDNAHLYGFVIIMRRLLNPEDFSTMKSEIISLCKKYPFVRMTYYGFRDDWVVQL